jgi:hypothetical protein
MGYQYWQAVRLKMTYRTGLQFKTASDPSALGYVAATVELAAGSELHGAGGAEQRLPAIAVDVLRRDPRAAANDRTGVVEIPAGRYIELASGIKFARIGQPTGRVERNVLRGDGGVGYIGH